MVAPNLTGPEAPQLTSPGDHRGSQTIERERRDLHALVGVIGPDALDKFGQVRAPECLATCRTTVISGSRG